MFLLLQHLIHHSLVVWRPKSHFMQSHFKRMPSNRQFILHQLSISFSVVLLLENLFWTNKEHRCSVSTVNQACQLSGLSLVKGDVLQGLLEVRLRLELLVQRLDGLLCLMAPHWLWMDDRTETRPRWSEECKLEVTVPNCESFGVCEEIWDERRDCVRYPLRSCQENPACWWGSPSGSRPKQLGQFSAGWKEKCWLMTNTTRSQALSLFL